jgi:uncharacterized protein
MGKKKSPLKTSPTPDSPIPAHPAPPRVVLDTNCLLSSLLFRNGVLSWIRRSWEAREFTPLVSAQTVDELIRVLAYPKFELSSNECRAVLEDFLSYAEVVQTKPSQSREYLNAKSKLTDRDDQIFLDLAFSSNTDVLVSGDKALLRLAKDISRFQILSPNNFTAWLDEHLWGNVHFSDDSEISWD